MNSQEIIFLLSLCLLSCAHPARAMSNFLDFVFSLVPPYFHLLLFSFEFWENLYDLPSFSQIQAGIEGFKILYLHKFSLGVSWFQCYLSMILLRFQKYKIYLSIVEHIHKKC